MSKQQAPFTLHYLAALHISGNDAGEFLHNQLSADVQGLNDGESIFACYCEPKGRVLALMLVSRHSDSYYVILSRSLTATIAKRLRIYVLRSQVVIETPENCTISAVPAASEQAALPPQHVKISIPQSGDDLLITSNGTSSENSQPLVDIWKMAELKRGITWLCNETSGQFLPQMLGFDTLGAVNFKKGCYPGQEIVARTHYLGKLKRHPRLLCTTAMICPDPLDKIGILSGDEQFEAVITDCAHREDSGGCLFVVTRMSPDLTPDQIEYRGQIADLV